MNIGHLIKLVSEVAGGKDKFKEGAVGFNGYGFVFRDFDYISKDSFIIGDGSSKLCSIGAFKDVYKKSLELHRSLKSSKGLLDYNPKFDLYFGGALRTLVPNMKFGGYESLFHVWMFVKTPKDQIFPATFYYGQSGTSVGAWFPDYRIFLSAEDKNFPEEFESIINFSPFKFSAIDLEEFIEALTLALNRVPVSDFEGVYEHDFGINLMGLKSGEPFVMDLGIEHKKIETWSYCIKGNDEATDLSCDFIEIKNSFFTLEEDKRYPQSTPIWMHKVLIERSYDSLIAHAYKNKSRLAFMVLGCFLMLHRVKLTVELKQTILKYSDWDYEKDQLENKEDRKERKKFLVDFREKIKNYDGTKLVKVEFYSVARIINEKREKGDATPIWRQNIDYSIKA